MYVYNQFLLIGLVSRVLTSRNNFTIYERSLALSIATRVNHTHSGDKKWKCWPSVETLCEDSCMGKTKLHETLNSLVKKGIIKYEKGAKGVANVYEIDVNVVGKIVGIDAHYTNKTDKTSCDEDENTPF